MPRSRGTTTNSNGRISAETFRFFRDLSRNNHKEWMDENRERYQSAVVRPFRGLLEELTPAAQKLYPGFDLRGRTGVNLSRINRDIRFAKDKSPYRPQMYLMLPSRGGGNPRPGELYVGVNGNTVTAGYRVYFDRETKMAALGSQLRQTSQWCVRQRRRMARRYESYWYSMEKSEWTKNEGWPVTPEDWKRLKAWVVRRKLSPAAAARPGFAAEVAGIFRQVFPLFRFMTQGGADQEEQKQRTHP
jgi:uncharacterized protein (TIGR02453 family)